MKSILMDWQTKPLLLWRVQGLEPSCNNTSLFYQIHQRFSRGGAKWKEI